MRNSGAKRARATVEGGGVQMGKNDVDRKTDTCYTYAQHALASTDISLYEIMCAQINLTNPVHSIEDGGTVIEAVGSMIRERGTNQETDSGRREQR